MIEYIRCKKCLNRGRLIKGLIPKHCPICGNKFNRFEDDDPTLIKTLLNLFSGGSGNERGFLIEDAFGFSKGEELKFPEGTKLEFY